MTDTREHTGNLPIRGGVASADSRDDEFAGDRGSCGCGSTTDTPEAVRHVGVTTRSYSVSGMACGHCADAVTGELMALGGVTHVRFDLVPGGTSRVTISSAASLDDTEVTAALEEAGGYQLLAHPTRPSPASLAPVGNATVTAEDTHRGDAPPARPVAGGSANSSMTHAADLV